MIIIAFFSSLQVIFRAKSSSNFDSEELLPLLKTIYGDPLQQEVIEDIDMFKDRISNLLAVTDP